MPTPEQQRFDVEPPLRSGRWTDEQVWDELNRLKFLYGGAMPTALHVREIADNLICQKLHNYSFTRTEVVIPFVSHHRSPNGSRYRDIVIEIDRIPGPEDHAGRLVLEYQIESQLVAGGWQV